MNETAMTPIIPGGCRFVWRCLSSGGKWSNLDLIRATGRNSSDVRLRELRRLNPGLVKHEKIPDAKSGALRFWLETP